MKNKTIKLEKQSKKLKLSGVKPTKPKLSLKINKPTLKFISKK